MTLETPFSRFAGRTVHIREVGGSSPSAPIYGTLVPKPGCFSYIWDMKLWLGLRKHLADRTDRKLIDI